MQFTAAKMEDEDEGPQPQKLKFWTKEKPQKKTVATQKNKNS